MNKQKYIHLVHFYPYIVHKQVVKQFVRLALTKLAKEAFQFHVLIGLMFLLKLMFLHLK